MSDSKLDPKYDEILAQWRRSIGREAFDAAQPGMTLRARTSQIAAAPTPDNTVVQPTAPKSATSATLAPKKDSLARWGEYAVQEMVGEGGMGQIFKADQGSLRRDVAIKKIIPEHLDKDSAAATKESFVSEALVTGFLEHPNIVPVHSLGQDEKGEWFFSMKMVRGIAWKYLLHPGKSADDATREKAKAMNLDIDDPARRAAHLEENLKILQTVCNAVAFAHSKNIIHRDLKPENVMVGAFGEVLVMDWGLAIDVSETPSETESRVPHKTMAGVGGTPEYMSPEQLYADGNRLSARTDVFLLGAILHELLTGKAPNAAEKLNTALIKAVQCEKTRKFKDAPIELAEICRKALSKDPNHREPDALAIRQALNDFLKHQGAATIAAKAEKEAKIQEIPNLARAVVLYDQALELWPENQATQDAVKKTRGTLAKKEGRNRLVWRGLGAAVAAIVVGLTVGFFWIRAEKERADANAAQREEQRAKAVAATAEAIKQTKTAEQKTKDEAEQKKKAIEAAAEALKQTKLAEQKTRDEAEQKKKAIEAVAEAKQKTVELENALTESRHYQGKTLLLRSNYMKESDHDCFASALMAARAIGFEGCGRTERDAVFAASFPQLLRPDSAEYHEAVLRSKEMFIGKPICIWQSAVSPQRRIAFAFSPDGSTIALGGFDNVIRLLDVASGKENASFIGHTDDILNVCFSPDGTTLASLSGLRVRLWDVETRKVKSEFGGPNKFCSSVAFSPDGTYLAIGVDEATERFYAPIDTYILLWNTKTGVEKARFRGQSHNTCCSAFDPSGTVLASADKNRAILLWDVATGNLKCELVGHQSDVTSLSFSPDCATLASGSQDDCIRFWDVATAKLSGKISGRVGEFGQVLYSPDGCRLASGGGQWGIVRIWDTSTKTEIGKFCGYSGGLDSLCFSPDGEMLVSSSGDSTVRVWDATQGNIKNILRGHLKAINCLAFSKHGGSLASGSDDNTVRVWDVITGQEKNKIEHTTKVLNVSFSPDGTNLASTTDDKTVHIWELATGKEISTSPVKGPQVPTWVNERTSAEASTSSLTAYSDDTQIIVIDSSIKNDLAVYASYYEIDPNGIKLRVVPNGMHYVNVNPSSLVGILRSGESQDEINRQLFWRYCASMNKNSAALMLSRLPHGKDRDMAQDAFTRYFETKNEIFRRTATVKPPKPPEF